MQVGLDVIFLVIYRDVVIYLLRGFEIIRVVSLLQSGSVDILLASFSVLEALHPCLCADG